MRQRSGWDGHLTGLDVERVTHLPDGRRITLLVAGPPDGYPVFDMHGIPSSAAEWRMWGSPELLERIGVRLLAVDRPGVGGSSHDPRRTLASTAADFAHIADELELSRFGVLSYSGGAACAMSVATDPRCDRAAVMAPMLPPTRTLAAGINAEGLRFLKLARHRFGLFPLAYRGTRLLWQRAPDKYVANAVASFGPADRNVFSRPSVHGPIMSTTGTARGQRLDVALAITPWHVDLSRITVAVDIWQGEEDRNVSIAMARQLADRLPSSHLRLLAGEGHISLPVRHATNILTKLIDQPQPAHHTP